MITATAEHITEGDLTSLGESTRFTLAVNAKAFRLLIDGLYSDKVASPVRELMTNAYDAHLEAGIADRPFDIELPTVLSPTFRVRDYGHSMTHEFVMTLYTTMFSSTKDTSNSQVGGFGIGSKSPFAYTDTFSVTCFQHGQRREYLAYLDDTGIPCLTHLETSPTDEPDGTAVSFPVASNRWAFEGAVTSLLDGFDVRPNGVEDIASRDWTLVGANWRAADAHNCVRIRQGCVTYPAPLFLDRSIRAMHVLIDVPLGTFGVTATREALEWTPEAIDKYSALMDQVRSDIDATFRTRINSARTWSEATRIQGLARVAMANEEFTGAWHDRPLSKRLALPAPLVTASSALMNTMTYEQVSDPKLRLVVRRPDLKVPRFDRRLRAYVKANKCRAYVIEGNPKKTIRALGLKPEQVISASALPDVASVKRPARPTGEIRGMTKADGGPLRHEDLTDPSQWRFASGSLDLGFWEWATGFRFACVVPSQADRAVRLGMTRWSLADHQPALDVWRAPAQEYVLGERFRFHGPLVRQKFGFAAQHAADSYLATAVCKLGLEAPESFTDTYPLLFMCHNPRSLDAELLDYINLIDARSALTNQGD